MNPVEKKSEKEKNPKGIFTVSVGSDLGSLIMKDAASEDRSNSYVVRKICEKHYASQLKKLRADKLSTPASNQLRRAA